MLCLRYFRMMCRPVLPLEKQVYGSADAGTTVHTSDPQFNEIMKSIGDELHFSAHLVADKVIYTAGGEYSSHQVLLFFLLLYMYLIVANMRYSDVEGHIGNDGRRVSCNSSASICGFIIAASRVYFVCMGVHVVSAGHSPYVPA